MNSCATVFSEHNKTNAAEAEWRVTVAQILHKQFICRYCSNNIITLMKTYKTHDLQMIKRRAAAHDIVHDIERNNRS